MPDNWQCPTCKGVWSPYNKKCPHCGTLKDTDGSVEHKESVPVSRAAHRMMLSEAERK